MKAFFNLRQAALSPLREQISQEAGDTGAGLLRACDVLDAALESAMIQLQDGAVEASLMVAMEDAAQAVLGWVASLEAARNESETEGSESDDGDDSETPRKKTKVGDSDGEGKSNSEPEAYFPPSCGGDDL